MDVGTFSKLCFLPVLHTFILHAEPECSVLILSNGDIWANRQTYTDCRVRAYSPLISCEQTSWHFATYLDLYYAEGAASKTWSKVLSESGQQTYYGPAKIMTASVCPFTLKLLPFWKLNCNKITNQFGMCETWHIFELKMLDTCSLIPFFTVSVTVLYCSAMLPRTTNGLNGRWHIF